MVGARARVLSFIGKLGNSPDDRASCARLSSRRIVSLSAQPLRLLGRPEASRKGRPLEFRSRREQALLFYLATEGGLHPREKLAALFWPESGEVWSRAALPNALYGRRRALREGAEEGASFLRSGRDSAVGLDLESGVELDLHLLKVASDATRLPVG